ncbi:MAG: glycosyltransferase [Caldilineaceae bacterium]
MREVQEINMQVKFSYFSSSNPFSQQLAEALCRVPEVTKVLRVPPDQKKLAFDPGGAEILHIHWPEHSVDRAALSLDYLKEIQHQITEAKRKAKIVTTIHNLVPHQDRGDSALLEALYRMVIESSDGLIHMGRISESLCVQMYGCRSGQASRIIPLGNYAFFANEVSQDAARTKLQLPRDAFVLVCFGRLRHAEELAFLLEGFSKANTQTKYLLIAGKFSRPSRLSQSYWQNWFWNLQKIRLHSKIQIYQEYIPDSNVQCFLNSADVVVIPRQKVLNASNVALGFTFGKVVIGPNVGVAGEILEQTGNLVFTPGKPDTLAKTIEVAPSLVKAGIGKRNQQIALHEWNWDRIAAQHVDFYQKLLSQGN